MPARISGPSHQSDRTARNRTVGGEKAFQGRSTGLILVGGRSDHQKQHPPSQNEHCNREGDPETIQHEPTTGDGKNSGENDRPGLTPPGLFGPEI